MPRRRRSPRVCSTWPCWPPTPPSCDTSSRQGSSISSTRWWSHSSASALHCRWAVTTGGRREDGLTADFTKGSVTGKVTSVILVIWLDTLNNWPKYQLNIIKVVSGALVIAYLWIYKTGWSSVYWCFLRSIFVKSASFYFHLSRIPHVNAFEF